MDQLFEPFKDNDSILSNFIFLKQEEKTIIRIVENDHRHYSQCKYKSGIAEIQARGGKVILSYGMGGIAAQVINFKIWQTHRLNWHTDSFYCHPARTVVATSTLRRFLKMLWILRNEWRKMLRIGTLMALTSSIRFDYINGNIWTKIYRKKCKWTQMHKFL